MMRTWLLLLAFWTSAAACKKQVAKDNGNGNGDPEPGQSNQTHAEVGSAANAPAVEVSILYGSEKKTWLEEQIASFNTSQHAVHVTGKPLGSGEAMSGILSGAERPTVFSPASSAYIPLLDEQWQAKPSGGKKALAPAGEPIVLSPIVIAMWKPMAEALGWPAKDIGWKDIIKVSKDPAGWGSVGHSEWGAFKLGHTHPEFSNSGLLAVLAEASAATGKTRGLSREDLALPKTQEFIGAIENAVVHYGKSTALFTDKMLERGPSYMSACVTYENLVIESYTRPGTAPFPLVAVYPVEGTFWSDHPYAILDAEWVGTEERAGAQQFLAFLKSKPMQARALALGFRPGDATIATTAPIDGEHGVDPKQPQTLLEVPSGEVLAQLLQVWRQQKKTAEVMIVFDRSGSMQGDPLKEAKAGARAFLDGLGDRDSAAIMFFDSHVPTPPAPVVLGTARASLQKQVDEVFADGGTSLYEAVAAAYDAMLVRAKREPGRIHALVVMTDGRDEGSKISLGALQRRFNPENAPVKIFTIAYGASADPAILDSIAKAAQGTSVKGSTDTIVQVYRDLSAFF